MEYDEFRALVKQMRAAQNRYFKKKGLENLKESKKLEKEVDDELDETRIF